MNDLSKLTPKQREAYDIMVAGWRAEWAAERLAREEAQRRRPWRERAARCARELTEELMMWAQVAAGFIVVAGIVGICIGVLVALVRAGWRAGASL